MRRKLFSFFALLLMAVTSAWADVDMKTVPLTLEAKTAGTIVVSNPQSGMQYSLNGGAKTAVTSDPIVVEEGQTVAFFGNSSIVYNNKNTDISDDTRFTGDADCYIYGNIMSLVDEENYSTATELTADSVFCGLFRDNTHLYNNATNDLVLPATTLSAGCYRALLRGCTNLTKAPALPATTLADYCYYAMFYGCTGLTTAPALPATALATYCYSYMFYGCTGLTAVPALPATTAVKRCYSHMFMKCESLTAAPTLPATTLGVSCYASMFSGCTSLSSAPALPATTLADSCYTSMFRTCTSLTSAPALPATTLTSNCYHAMFWGSGLTAVPALPATTLERECYRSMFTECKALTSISGNLLPATTLAPCCYYGMFNKSGLTDIPEKLLPATTLADSCYTQMFYQCIGLTEIPEKLLPATTLATDCYRAMFYGCTELTEIPENLLPVTTLAEGCYRTMFYRCTGLTEIPEDLLPATTLTKACYSGMFYNCDGLTTIPEDLLHATTLADSCYASMFYGCSELTTIPENLLPVTTLAKACYAAMFMGCSKLTNAPALPATTLASDCYRQMFQSCTSLATAPILPAETLANGCYRQMFRNCTELTVIPTGLLPATTLVENCYNQMFYGCTKLGAVTCLATDISATDATYQWLFSVKSSGRFIKASTMSDWTRNSSAIPSAWAVWDYDEDLCTPLTLEAKTAGTIVVSSPKSGMKYSKNGGEKTAVTSSAIDVAVGDKVQFFGNGTSINNYDGTKITGGTADCYIYGNIMSLVDETDFEDAYTLTGSDFTFNALFSGNTHMYNHDTKMLNLPATTLIRGCYQAMFQGCTSLTSSPATLSAKALQNLCYKQMFEGCTGLTTAPELPATTLKSSCYYQMFKDCTGLTTAPTLPAKTSANYCYYQMFKDCSSLNSVSCLATSLSASNPTTNWLSGVAATGTFTKATSRTWATGVTGIPDGWTIVNNDPVTLTDGDDLSSLVPGAGGVCEVNYSREFTESKPSTVCLPFAYEVKDGEKFYTFGGITKEGDDFVATMTEYTGDNLVANTPYLYVPASTGATDFSGTYTLPAAITAGTTTSGDWKFVGTYTTQEWGAEAPTGIYGFSAQATGNIKQGEFVKVGAYVRVKPMRSYLMYKNGDEDYRDPSVRGFSGFEGGMMTSAVSESLPERIKVRFVDANGEVTGIGTLNTQTGDVNFDSEAWYTLDGIRLAEKPTQKGIYVNNGKKVMIK